MLVSTRNQGAFVVAGGVEYVIWAPERREVKVLVNPGKADERAVNLTPCGDGYFAALDSAGRTHDRYFYDLGDGKLLPDFTSRFQPEGIHGASMVVDPAKYVWHAKDWKRPAWRGQVIYELHIGTFSPEGTYSGAIPHLDHLRDTGVTCIEVMPVAEWAGRKNWGYDGVFLFAPAHAYGTPDEFRAFIDACHERGLAVILDVVYNHLGPQGNVAPMFSPYYFYRGKDTPWGQNFDLDEPHSPPVRALLKQNVAYWLDEFRLDGFRFDATQAIPDSSPVHLLAELSEMIHAKGGLVVAEDERNSTHVLDLSERKGWDFDAVWADDFHHAMRVSQSPSTERYYAAFKGSAEEIARTIDNGWLYCGDVANHKGVKRGTQCRHLPPEKFVYCISNHDQVGNRPFAERFHHAISPAAYRAVSAFFLLLPYTPMLFMGQEFSASTPFHFFTDYEGDLAKKMAGYRRKEFDRLGMHVPEEREKELPDPQSDEAFNLSKLNWDDLKTGEAQATLSLYKAALVLRRELHPSGNPGRRDWSVRAEGDVVVLTYRLPEREVQVQFAVKDGRDLPNSPGKVLFRSRPENFDSDAAQPETIVIEIPRGKT